MTQCRSQSVAGAPPVSVTRLRSGGDCTGRAVQRARFPSLESGTNPTGDVNPTDFSGSLPPLRSKYFKGRAMFCSFSALGANFEFNKSWWVDEESTISITWCLPQSRILPVVKYDYGAGWDPWAPFPSLKPLGYYSSPALYAPLAKAAAGREATVRTWHCISCFFLSSGALRFLFPNQAANNWGDESIHIWSQSSPAIQWWGNNFKWQVTVNGWRRNSAKNSTSPIP